MIPLDIETLPDPRGPRPEYVKVPSNYKKPDSIAEYVKDNANSAWRSTSTNPMFGVIYCIGFAILDGPVVVLSQGPNLDEAGLLSAFWSHVSPFAHLPLVAHNGTEFDFRFISTRAMKHGLMDLARRTRPARWPTPQLLDTATPWPDGKFTSFDAVCDFFHIQRKPGIDGSMVLDAYLRQRYTDITDHCREDVEDLRSVANRMREGGWL